MCRSIVRFFVAVFIILFGTLLILLLNIRFRLLESTYYKIFLRENNVYELALNTGKDYLENSGDQQGTLLIQPVLDTIVNDLVTPEFIQKIVEKNLDNVFAFINGREERLYMYFPKDEILAKLDIETIDSLEGQITALIDSLPTCAPGQELQFEGEDIGVTTRVECLPEGFTAPTQDFSQLLADLQTYTGKNALEGIFEEGGLLPGFNEQTDIAKFISNSPREPGAPDPEVFLTTTQNGFRYFNIGLIVAGVLLAGSIVIYILLGDRSKIAGSSGTILLLLGLPALAIGAFLSFSGYLSSFLFDKLISQELPPEMLEQFGFIPDLISKFLSGAFLPIFITGVVLIIIGIILILVQKLLLKQPATETKLENEVRSFDKAQGSRKQAQVESKKEEKSQKDVVQKRDNQNKGA